MQNHHPRFFDFKMRLIILSFAVLIAFFGIFHVAEILDAHFYYSEAEALQYFQQLSIKDRELYQKFAVVDLFFILNYVSFLFIALKRKLTDYPKIKYLAFLPGIFDLIETGFILNFLRTDQNFGQFAWLGFITALKWITLSAVLAILALGALKRRN